MKTGLAAPLHLYYKRGIEQLQSRKIKKCYVPLAFKMKKQQLCKKWGKNPYKYMSDDKL